MQDKQWEIQNFLSYSILTVGKYERNKEWYLKFVVSDTGVGISKQDIPKLFKMFGMLSKHRSKMNQSGTGLGLAISKKIVESLGGKIKVSSCENEWTKFTFTVKYMPEEINRSEENKHEGFDNNLQSLPKEESKLQNLYEEVKFWYIIISLIYSIFYVDIYYQFIA